MTIYLPTPDPHPPGYDPGEFIEVPDMAHDVAGATSTSQENKRSFREASAVSRVRTPR